jgi:hypothetical protein
MTTAYGASSGPSGLPSKNDASKFACYSTGYGCLPHSKTQFFAMGNYVAAQHGCVPRCEIQKPNGESPNGGLCIAFHACDIDIV